MCEYCNGTFRDGQDVIVYVSPVDLKWTLIMKDYERRISFVRHVNYCPMCGRKLNNNQTTAQQGKGK